MSKKTDEKPISFRSVDHVDAGAFRPMLADKAPKDTKTLAFPVLVSPKLDGIRCVIHEGVALSRKLKPIPNAYVQRCLGVLPDGLDGELMLRSGSAGGFNAVQSAVMREEGEPDFVFNVFDRFESGSFQTRFQALDNLLRFGLPTRDRVALVPHCLVADADELLRIEECAIADGFEGVMIRSLAGPYKCGRSTTKQGFLLKLKRFEDAEATVIGVEELMHNDNEAIKDALGHTKRSSAKAGKRAAGTLGKLVVKRADGVEFEVGTGFTAEMRASLWERREALPGLVIKYKFQPGPAAPQNRPRFPVYLGTRHPLDMG